MSEETTPTAEPRRRRSSHKANAAGVAGALATLVAWASAEFTGVDIPAGVEGALTTIFAAGAAFFRRD